MNSMSAVRGNARIRGDRQEVMSNWWTLIGDPRVTGE